MAQAGAYTPGPVNSVAVNVKVNGTARDYVSMSWAGDTTGGLPEQVVSAGTGMRSREGRILWAPQDPVTLDPPHPLRRVGGWPPREGDTVTIDATYNAVIWRRFTGRIGRTTGSLIDGTLESEITDTLGDSLRSLCTVPPIISNASHYMRTHWSMYGALAQAGLGAIPGPDDETVLWNGYQGGTRPLVGEWVASGIEYGDGYGLSAWSNVETAPDGTARAGRDVLVIARGWSGSAAQSVKVTIGTQVVTLTYTPSTSMYSLHSTATGTVGSWPRTGTSPLPLLAVQFRGVDTRVYTSPTTYVSTAALLVPQADAVTRVSGELLTGVSVRYLSGNAAPSVVARATERPVGILRSALEQERITATRGIENTRARSVVDSWSQATLASVWMDEYGKPWCVARDRLVSTAPSRAVEVTERVFDGTWSIGDDSIRSGVVIKGTAPSLQSTGRAGFHFTAYQDDHTRGFDVDPGVVERFVEVPSEQEWGPIDTTFGRFGTTGSAPNAGLEGSWVGAVTAANDAGDQVEQWAQFDSVTYLTSVQRLGQRRILITEELSGIPSGKTLYLKTASSGTSAHPAMRGVPSPIIRAGWITTWADYTLTGASQGPAWAEPLELDTDWWLTPADAQRVADALAAEVTKSMPTLTGVRTLWDPRRQIGDVETWTALDHSGTVSWTARVLVTGYAESWDRNVPTQDVDVRVITMTDPLEGKTYLDLSAAYSAYSGMSGGTYQGVYDALPDSI